jgi:GNAT superfamily N-acetyltransferase
VTAPEPRLDLRHQRYDDATSHGLIEELQVEYVQRYGGRDATPVDPQEFAPPQGAFLVLTADDEPVACAGLRRHDDHQVEVKRMFVRGPFRGRGLSRRLLTFVEDEARRLGYSRILLETGSAQPEAVGLYRTSGYQPIPGFGYYADQPGNLCFAKDLEPR